MNIGIVGIGAVGSAVMSGLEDLGHNVQSHDIRLETSIRDVIKTEICFICVPTPSKEDGSCNVDIVESVLGDLSELNYRGISVIKSTVTPGTTEKMKKKYPKISIAFVPEFLRERCALSDFTDNHDVCIIGTDNVKDFKKIKKSHGHYPAKFIHLSPTEAELTKYFNNVYNSTLITFANSFYEICKALDVNYTNVKNAVVNRTHIVDKYLECNNKLRGFGGVCLPKDLRAIDALVRDLDLDIDFFDMLEEENAKYKTTVYKGMRKQ
jgi:UDPglucose 6-dehydrogenase